MKVKCIVDNLNEIKDQAALNRLSYYIRCPDGEFGLVLGREYVVYGLAFWKDSPMLYICVDSEDEYPKPVALDFFDISDARLSKYWVFNYKARDDKVSSSLMVFKEWAEDPDFYEKLIDGDYEVVKLFSKIRIAMDVEFNI